MPLKAMLLNVPQWYPMNPYLACALLKSECIQAGHEASYRDTNIEFFNEILTEKSVLSAAEHAEKLLSELETFYKQYDNPEKHFYSYSKETRVKLLRYREIRGFFESKSIDIKETASTIEDAVAILKDKEKFYNPELQAQAKDIIFEALKIISLPYSPNRIQIDNYISDAVYSFSFNDIKAQCENPDDNMFIAYYEKKADELNLDKYDIVGISVTDLSQLIPALTLCRIIRKRFANKKIVLGGNYIFKITEDIKNYPEFFDIFCDYILIGDGENTFVELLDYLDGKRNISDVYSMMYCSGNEVIRNQTAPLLEMDKITYPNFDDVNFQLYFSPDYVFPVQLGKGCYWSKCKFCDFYTGQQKFDIKSVNRAADEVEYIVRKYNAENFIFVDECVPPKYYDRLATEILKRNLKINFYSFARFDAGFTREVLQNLFNAGARFLIWGYEAESPRLLKLMNKGINPDIRRRILYDCIDIGMWTECTFLLGYPTETDEELMSTIKIIENRHLINSCTPSNFVLKKNAILKDETNDVGITDYNSNGDFHISFSYHSLNNSMEKVKKNRLDFEKRFLRDTADSLWSLGFTDTDHLLLYLAKYGRDWVRDYRLKRPKKKNT